MGLNVDVIFEVKRILYLSKYGDLPCYPFLIRFSSKNILRR